MGEVYTCFQTKAVQKPYPLGQHIPIWLILGNSPPPPAPFRRPGDQNGSRKLTFSHFPSFSALTGQIGRAGVKTKAFKFFVRDGGVRSSETSNFRLLFMTSGTSECLLLKLAYICKGVMAYIEHVLGWWRTKLNHQLIILLSLVTHQKI